MDTTRHYIIIDGSYFIFHRYHAIKLWYKNAIEKQKDLDNNENEENIDNSNNEKLDKTFIDKFMKTFNTKINEIQKKLKINKNEQILKLVGLDCPRKDIWRKEIFPEYKESRSANDKHIKDIFTLTYKNKLFQHSGVDIELQHNRLEADDVIAITTKYIKVKYPNSKIWIITSDMDYLQLAEEYKVMLFDLSFKELTKKRNSSNNPQKDLFYKIVMGDKSDNIPAIFNKCGFRTAEKLYNNRDDLLEKFKNDKNIEKQYELNTKLIDFNYIPLEHSNDFKKKIDII